MSESTETCPWRDGTSILSFTSLGLVQVFLLFFMFRMKKNSLNVPLSVFAVLVIGALIATMICMIIDMSDGHKAFNKGSGQDKQSYRPGFFIVNTTLVFLGIVMVAILAVLGRKIIVEEPKPKIAVNIPQLPTATNTPIPSIDTSRTSRSALGSQSIYMTNGYSGLNSDWVMRSTAKIADPYVVRQY